MNPSRTKPYNIKKLYFITPEKEGGTKWRGAGAWTGEKGGVYIVMAVVGGGVEVSGGEVEVTTGGEDVVAGSEIIIDGVADADNNRSRILKNLRRKHDETKRIIMGICSNIYFAGSETSALLATWTLILLAKHPHWQECLRSEILDTFPNISSPHCFQDMDKFRKLKQLTMVIQESLRLYPPGLTTAREALEDMKIGEMVVPKGTNIWGLVPAMHGDIEIWGD
ncbi:hypothetical protein K1719_023238 [Acacia pycnantha]|nr:hypothetical protein K1719_023238 [Acacia pycnantha]